MRVCVSAANREIVSSIKGAKFYNFFGFGVLGCMAGGLRRLDVFIYGFFLCVEGFSIFIFY
jgi:hypothetical protein